MYVKYMRYLTLLMEFQNILNSNKGPSIYQIIIFSNWKEGPVAP